MLALLIGGIEEDDWNIDWGFWMVQSTWLFSFSFWNGIIERKGVVVGSLH